MWAVVVGCYVTSVVVVFLLVLLDMAVGNPEKRWPALLFPSGMFAVVWPLWLLLLLAMSTVGRVGGHRCR